jgi:hypothetical protein
MSSLETSPPPSRRLRRLPSRYAGIVMPFLLSLLMTCIVSFISTIQLIGLRPGVLQAWLSAWGLSWIIAFPVLLIVLPIVRRLTGLLVRPA